MSEFYRARQIISRVAAAVGMLAFATSCINSAESTPYSFTRLGNRVVSIKGNGNVFVASDRLRNGIYDLNELCTVTGISKKGNSEFIVNTQETNCPADLTEKSAYTPRLTFVINTPEFTIVQISKNVIEVSGNGASWSADQNKQKGLNRVFQACPDSKVFSDDGTRLLVVSQEPNCLSSMR